MRQYNQLQKHMVPLTLLWVCAILMVACAKQQHASFSLTDSSGNATRITRDTFEFPQAKQVGRKGLASVSYDFNLPESDNVVHAALCLDRKNVYWGYHPVSLNDTHVGNVLPNTYGALYSRPKQTEQFCVNLPHDALKDGDNTLVISTAVDRESFELSNATVVILNSVQYASGTISTELPPDLAYLQVLTEREQYIALIESPSIRNQLMRNQNGEEVTAATALSMIGEFHASKGNYLAALKTQERAVGMARDGHSPMLVTFQMRLGEAHIALGNREEAILFFEEALTLEREESSKATIQGRDAAMGDKGDAKVRLSPLAQDIMARMALGSLRLDDLERAEELAQQLLDEAGNRDFYNYVGKKAWWNPVPLAMAYMVIGEVNLRQGYYNEAQQAFEDAYVFLPSLDAGLEHRAIYGQANALFHADQYAEALDTLERLHDPNHGTRWKSDFLKGRIHEAQGRLEEAIEQYATSIELIEISRAQLGDHDFKVSFMDDKQEPYACIIRCLLQLERESEALEYTERAKARAFVDLLANRDDIRLQATDSVHQVAIMRRLAALEDRHVNGERSNDVIIRAIQTETLRNDLRTQSLKLASLVMVDTPGVEAIRSHLGEDEVLVEFFTHGSEAMVIGISRDAIDSAILQGNGLSQAVIRFRQSLSDTSSQKWKTEAQKLYRDLLGSISPMLKGKQLVIVPHGVLHYLPFGALMNNGRVLIEDHAIRVLPSASVQAQLEGATPNGNSILIFGNPDLGDAAMDLPGAEAEARQVRTLWPESRVLLRKDASETLFKETSPHFSSMHVAAHGQFSPFAPLESALLLSPDETNDGRLTVAELYGLRLNADLVVLSACESGLGTMQSGDEMVSLTRGFFYAGTRSILASLWQIPDAETAYLMENFHGLNGKESWGEALRQAQLASKKRFDHPYYWAGFELFGL